jgi:ribonucrease Y
MELNIISIIVGVVALVIGTILGKIIFAKNTKKQVEEAEQQSKLILKEAELRAEN